jgi:hypothetical protein
MFNVVEYFNLKLILYFYLTRIADSKWLQAVFLNEHILHASL